MCKQEILTFTLKEKILMKPLKPKICSSLSTRTLYVTNHRQFEERDTGKVEELSYGGKLHV